jgi:hypothetical protein
MYKGVKIRKREKLHDVKLAQSRCQNLSMSRIDACGRSAIFLCQKPMAYNRLAMVMGGVFWRGGSREVTKPKATTRLKIEDACILCNVIKTFWQRKVIKVKRRRPFDPFKLQMALAQSCKNTLACLCKQPNTSIAKGGNWSLRC